MNCRIFEQLPFLPVPFSPAAFSDNQAVLIKIFVLTPSALVPSIASRLVLVETAHKDAVPPVAFRFLLVRFDKL